MRVTNEVVEMMEESATNAIVTGPPGVYECAHHLLTLCKAYRVMLDDVATILTDVVPIENYLPYEGAEVSDAS